MFKLTSISVILFITTIANFFAAYIGWQRRKTRSGLYFALGMLGISFWTLAGGFDYAAVSIPLKVFFAKLEYTSYNTAFVFLALFVLAYAGYDDLLEKTLVRIFFWIIPISNILLAWTNEWHGWLWSGFVKSKFGDNTVIFEHGPGYLWAVITGYLMILIIIMPLWQASRRGSVFSRRQARLLFFSSLIPILGNLFYVFQPPEHKGVDWTSITFSISSLLFLSALYGTRLLDLVPIARHTMIERMTDCVLVLDVNNRVVDINLSAQDIFEITQNQVGNPINEIMSDRPKIIDLFSSEPDQTPHITLTYKGRERVFDTHLTLLTDPQGQLYGKLIVFSDVTERYQAEQALEQRLLEIQELHKNLQETQAQLVEQQRTLAALDERKRLGRDMHDSVNQSIHSLMLFSETLIVLLEKDQTKKAIDVAERIQENGRQALKEIRLLVYETQSMLIDQNMDLLDALEQRLNMVERRVGIKAEIICDEGFMDYCPPEWSENLYWMMIEALNNSLKHAKARSIKVTIHCTQKKLEAEVKDNGIGFDTSQVRSGGFGMRTMRERAEILGGELSVKSTPGYGTRVSFKTEIGV